MRIKDQNGNTLKDGSGNSLSVAAPIVGLLVDDSNNVWVDGSGDAYTIDNVANEDSDDWFFLW